MLTMRIKTREKDPRQLIKQLKEEIQSAIGKIESAASNIEYALSERPEMDADTSEKLILEDIGLSATAHYSLADIERLKIAVKWALEGD